MNILVDRITWFLFVAIWIFCAVRGEMVEAGVFLVGSVLLNVLLRIEKKINDMLGDKL